MEDGEVLRLKDIARIELGRMTYSFNNTVNGHKAVSCIVYQMAGTNATQTISDIEALLDDYSTKLPAGLKINIAQSANDFLFASIHEVIKTLIEAFILVFIVVYIFLQDMRSTLIPAIAIPVALIATFFVLKLIGFSINLLTLSAMVLAIAIVVDDAIVVVEGVHAKLDQGYKSARAASIDAMHELGGAIVSITRVMMSVFVPVSFMGGTAGTFYRQFGLTMAIAIAFSAINALTLSPALCAIFLKPHHSDASLKERVGTATKEARKIMIARYADSLGRLMRPGITLIFTIVAIIGMIFGLFSFENHPILCIVMIIISILALAGMTTDKFKDNFNNSYNGILGKYKKQVLRFIQKRWLSAGIVAASVVLLVVFMQITPTGMVPNEDTGTIMGAVTLPPGTSQERAQEILNRVDSLVASDPAVQSRTIISGFSFIGGQGPSYGSVIIKLKNWSERPDDEDYISSVIAEIYRRTANIHSAKLFAFAQPTIMGYSTGSGVELYVQGRAGGSIETLKEHTDKFIAALNARPEVQMAYTTFDTKFPQYLVEVDAARCKRMGVSPSDVLSVMSGYIGGNYVSNLNRFSKLYRVYIQADKDFRLNKDALNNMFVRTEAGEMAPIGQFVTLSKAYGPETLTRFNLYSSIQVNAMMNDGYSSGDVIQAVAEVAQETLPVGYGYEYAGITREEAGSGSNTIIVFALCIVFIYLILCALYESLFVPLAVMLSVPFGLVGSFALSNLCGLENNIYMQTGLIMLIGLLAKTAILITEYAATRRQGMTLAQAAVSAAAIRLRPILMTVLCMAIGMLPLVFASGAGANGNISLGTGVVGVLLVGTLALLFVVPVLFIVFQAMEERLMPARKHED